MNTTLPVSLVYSPNACSYQVYELQTNGGSTQEVAQSLLTAQYSSSDPCGTAVLTGASGNPPNQLLPDSNPHFRLKILNSAPTWPGATATLDFTLTVPNMQGVTVQPSQAPSSGETIFHLLSPNNGCVQSYLNSNEWQGALVSWYYTPPSIWMAFNTAGDCSWGEVLNNWPPGQVAIYQYNSPDAGGNGGGNSVPYPVQVTVVAGQSAVQLARDRNAGLFFLDSRTGTLSQWVNGQAVAKFSLGEPPKPEYRVSGSTLVASYPYSGMVTTSGGVFIAYNQKLWRSDLVDGRLVQPVGVSLGSPTEQLAAVGQTVYALSEDVFWRLDDGKPSNMNVQQLPTDVAGMIGVGDNLIIVAKQGDPKNPAKSLLVHADGTTSKIALPGADRFASLSTNQLVLGQYGEVMVVLFDLVSGESRKVQLSDKLSYFSSSASGAVAVTQSGEVFSVDGEALGKFSVQELAFGLAFDEQGMLHVYDALNREVKTFGIGHRLTTPAQ